MTVLERNCDQLVVEARLPNLYSFCQAPWRRVRDVIRKIESTLYQKLLAKLPGKEHQEAAKNYGKSLGGLATYLDDICRRLDHESGQELQVEVLGQSPEPVTYLMMQTATPISYNHQSDFVQLATGVNMSSVNMIYHQQNFDHTQVNVAPPSENVQFQLQQVQHQQDMDESCPEGNFSQDNSSNDNHEDLITEAESSEKQHSKRTTKKCDSRVRSKKATSTYKPRPERSRFNFPHIEPLLPQEGEDTELALKRPFKCPTCGQRYINRMNFQRHWLTHLPEESKRFKCDQCPLRFHFACLLKTHQLHHKEDKSIQCPDCTARFVLPYELYAHQRNNHQPDRVKPHKCDYCDKRYDKPSELKKHVETKHLKLRTTYSNGYNVKRHKCEVCEKMCWSRADLLNHMKRKHSSEPRPTFRCDYCGRMFSSKKVKDSHMSKMHESEGGPLQCGLCDASLLNKANMRVHFVQKHDEHKCEQCNSGSAIEAHVHAHPNPEQLTVQCDQCKEKFFDPVALARHKRKEHYSDNPYKHPCGFCDVTCSSELALTLHRRLKHDDKLLFACNFCGLKFSTNQQLRDHRKRHMLTEDLPCEKCSKRFKTPPDLRKHWDKFHSTEKQGKVYVCHECNSKYRDLSNHLKHLRLHRGDFPYGCQLCDRRFANQSKLNRHKDTDHKDELPKYQCFECSMVFANESQRIKHAFSEHGPKSFDCNHCELKFSTSDEVRKHELTHFESSQLFSCDKCDEKYVTKSELTIHHRRHQALTKPKFQCVICGNKYRYEKNLLNHLKTAHSGLESPPQSSEISMLEHNYAKKPKSIIIDH